MNFRKSRKVMNILFIIGSTIALVGQIFKQPGVAYSLLFAGLFIVVAGVVVVFKFWKCPHCNHALSPRESDILYCPYCSKKL